MSYKGHRFGRKKTPRPREGRKGTEIQTCTTPVVMLNNS